MEFSFGESAFTGRSRANERALRHRPCPARTLMGFQEVSRSRQKRQVLQGMVRPLKRWLVRHRDNPYPTRAEKIALAFGSKMTLVQVSNWFANARRRLKNTVKRPNVTWAKRVKLYNSCVEGNAELLSISSEDSIWQLDDSDHELDVASSSTTNVDHCYSAPESSEISPICLTSPASTIQCHSNATCWLPVGDPQTPPTEPPLPSPSSSLTGQVTKPARCKRARELSEDERDGRNVRQAADANCYDDDRPRKYKRSILQRYLHDSLSSGSGSGSGSATVHQQQQQHQHQQKQKQTDEAVAAGSSRPNGPKKFAFSDSDFFTSSCQSLSTSTSSTSTSTSSRSSVDWSPSLSDDEPAASKRTTADTSEHSRSAPVRENNKYWKEFDAAIVLVSLGHPVQ